MQYTNLKTIYHLFYLLCFYLIIPYLLFLSLKLFAAETPLEYVKFTTDFDAKCVTRGGVMIYISNNHPSKTLKVTLERWFMDNKTGDRSRSILKPSDNPEALGCSKVSNLKQEWRIKKAEWYDR